MQTKIIHPFKIIGISIQTTNENDLASKDIAALWGRFMDENFLTKIPNKTGSDIYSLYTSYEGDHTLPYTTILKQWEKIFELDLNRTYLADFEIYGEKAQNPLAAEVDFYVGIKDE